jgi:hypothetical protein
MVIKNVAAVVQYMVCQCITADSLKPAHANGSLRSLVGPPRLGETVVVWPGEHTSDQGKSRTGSECAPPHRLTVRWVFKYHCAVTSVVGGLHQPSQQARLCNDKCQPVHNNRKKSVSILLHAWIVWFSRLSVEGWANIHWNIYKLNSMFSKIG